MLLSGSFPVWTGGPTRGHPPLFVSPQVAISQLLQLLCFVIKLLHPPGLKAILGGRERRGRVEEKAEVALVALCRPQVAVSAQCM